jgi:hypothetical protein
MPMLKNIKKKPKKKDTRKPNPNSTVFKKFQKIVREGKG